MQNGDVRVRCRNTDVWLPRGRRGGILVPMYFKSPLRWSDFVSAVLMAVRELAPIRRFRVPSMTPRAIRRRGRR